MTSSGFRPVAGPDARVLILGSLPGKESLARRQYYAQPRNAFWLIMGDIAGAEPYLPYQERLRRLVAQRFALWDVCASAARVGSLDSAIRTGTVRANDFGRFFVSHPDLRLVCFNGAKAAALFKRVVLPTPKMPCAHVHRTTLPSTSPAYASMPVRNKIQTWRAALLESGT